MKNEQQSIVAPCAFLAGGGVAGALARSTDWSATPVGPISSWPISLKSIVGTILHSRQPMFLWWGPELVQFYNDAYLPSFGTGKHPAAMGQRGRDCWRESWLIIGPQIDDVMSRAQASWNVDALVPIFRNGRVEDVYWTYGYSPVFDDAGGVGGTLVVCTETTTRVVAERALLEASDDLEITLHSLGDGVIATDLAGAIVRMNPAAERLTGWQLAEAKGRAAADVLVIVDEETRVVVEDPVRRTLRGDVGAVLPSRAVLVRRDGSEMPMGDSCAPIKRPDGTIRGAVLVFRDATNDRLAETIQEKFRKQLVSADRMASVGTLAAGVAHEINNPLTIVIANVEMALEDLRPTSGSSARTRVEDLQDTLVAARDAATRIAKVVGALKVFSRVERASTDVIDVVSVLDLSVDLAFNEIRDRARLMKEYGAVPRVVADAARLGQVLVNLLVNAAQAFPSKQDANEIRIVTSTDAAGRAVVEIRDTGPGMSPATLARVFDPLFTTKRLAGGAGVGVAICHSIVTGMGGELTVASDLGVGTTFRVVLQPAKTATDAPATAVAPEAAPQRTARVLIVDDEPAVGLALRRVLRGHEVTLVKSAQEALAVLETGKAFDVVLSDLMMPGMSGMEFHRALTLRFPQMAPRIVFVTGGAFTTEASAFLAGIPNERLQKPFDFKRLRALVSRFAP